MAVSDDSGRESRTSYRVLEQLNSATLVEAVLHTGRTHQIRVHFQHIGYPLAGDETYGARQNRRLKESTGLTAARVMLHAFQLNFVHPKAGERMTFEAPFPTDFSDFLESLRLK